MSESNVVSIQRPAVEKDTLSEVLREGAQRLLAEAVEAEVEDFLAQFRELRTAEGKRRVVRNGHLPEREIQCGLSGVKVQVPRVRDREPSEGDGQAIRYQSSLVPRYLRRTRTSASQTSSGTSDLSMESEPTGSPPELPYTKFDHSSDSSWVHHLTILKSTVTENGHSIARSVPWLAFWTGSLGSTLCYLWSAWATRSAPSGYSLTVPAQSFARWTGLSFGVASGRPSSTRRTFERLPDLLGDESMERLSERRFLVPLLKALLLHGVQWGSSQGMVEELLRTAIDEDRNIDRMTLGRYLGYGFPEEDRLEGCHEQRATLFGSAQGRLHFQRRLTLRGFQAAGRAVDRSQRRGSLPGPAKVRQR